MPQAPSEYLKKLARAADEADGKNDGVINVKKALDYLNAELKTKEPGHGNLDHYIVKQAIHFLKSQKPNQDGNIVRPQDELIDKAVMAKMMTVGAAILLAAEHQGHGLPDTSAKTKGHVKN